MQKAGLTQSTISELKRWKMWLVGPSFEVSEPVSFRSPGEWEPEIELTEVIKISIIWKDKSDRLKQSDVLLKKGE